jgi:hypothetical protein
MAEASKGFREIPKTREIEARQAHRNRIAISSIFSALLNFQLSCLVASRSGSMKFHLSFEGPY